MRVELLIAALELMDPKAPAMLMIDGNLYDVTTVEQIHPDHARIEKRHKHTVVLG